VQADFIAETRCEVLFIPVSLFQSVIVAEPGVVQQLSRTIAERMKSILTDPAKAARAAKRRRSLRTACCKATAGENPRHQLRLVVAQVHVSHDTTTNPTRRADWWSALAWTAPALASRTQGEDEAGLAEGGFAEAFQGHGRGADRARKHGVIGGAGKSASSLIASFTAARSSRRER
jgi:acetate kinase